MPFTLLSLALAATAVSGAAVIKDQPIHRRQQSEGEGAASFDWASIEPTPELIYHPCFLNPLTNETGAARCARLQVPLDWSNVNDTSSGTDTDGRSAAIAIKMIPAAVPRDHPDFGGTVLYNPGGPGSSVGDDDALQEGLIWQGVLSGVALDEGVKHYEMLFFDPRGVGLTTPPAMCSTTSVGKAETSLSVMMAPAMDDGGIEAIYDYSLVQAEFCRQTDEGLLNGVAAHLSTASVAMDMVAIIDAVAEERDSASGNKTRRSADEEEARLQYIGVSYGTYLGNVFASMFPGRVGRMLLDSNTDADDYIRGYSKSRLTDTEAVLDHMYKRCWEIDTCPLKVKGDCSWKDMKARVNDAIDALAESPQLVIANDHINFIKAETVAGALQPLPYNPDANLQDFAMTAAALVMGNLTFFAQPPTEMPENINFANESLWPIPGITDDANMVIRCLDGYQEKKERERRDLEWAENFFKDVLDEAPTVGRTDVAATYQCSNWTIKPSVHFTGPSGSPKPDDSPDAPSAPILFVNSRLDTVTPLQNAYKMSALHEGSSVLIQEGSVHGASAGHAASDCTVAAVRKYFQTGEVPKNGTVCGDFPWEKVRDEDGWPSAKLIQEYVLGKYIRASS